MIQTATTLLALLFTFPLFASGQPGLSAKRAPTQTYEMLRGHSTALQTINGRRIPEQLKVDLSQLDTSNVPEINDPALFVNSFKHLRDTRFIRPENSDFARRLTWLFPDDGCYARAEIEAIYAQQKGLPAPAKIFAFGNLNAKTNNTPSGVVTWWYHVSVAYKHQGVVYVWDPAIEPNAPLTIKQWGQHMGSENTRVDFALCSAKTFDPDHDCVAPVGVTMQQALQEQSVFLSPEWSRLEYLGRNPTDELGELPPWLNIQLNTQLGPIL